MMKNVLLGVRRRIARQIGFQRVRDALDRLERRGEAIEARLAEAEQTRAALAACQARLTEREAELVEAQAQLAFRQARLAECEGQLTDARAARDWLDSILYPWIAAAVRNTILNASPESSFKTDLNGATVMLPRDTIRTMIHCTGAHKDGPVYLRVEDAHCQWMGDRLPPGGVFLDVGAATGATTLPLARRHGGRVRVIAFEPARAANKLLRATLEANGYGNVEVIAAAVSDAAGTVRFAEYPQDETGETPFLPEASAIVSPQIDANRTETYEVPVTTLDRFLADRPADAERTTVVKIDVEGFEVAVIDGAAEFLRRVRPHLSIDIHKHPFRDGVTTEGDVRERLAGHGYRFEKTSHVLFCYPS